MRILQAWVPLLLTLGVVTTPLQVIAQDPYDCRQEAAGDAGTTNGPLYCMPLVPTPTYRHLEGTARLVRPERSPFMISTTAEGYTVWDVLVNLKTQPELSDDEELVAWITTPDRRIIKRLGTVSQGQTRLGPIPPLNQFTVRITRERKGSDAARGPTIMRALSPSTYMDTHDLAMRAPEALIGGQFGEQEETQEMPGNMHHHHAPSTASPVWPMAPMHPSLGRMPVGLHSLRPDVSPWRPRFTGTIPPAQPMERLKVADGDTIHLELAPVTQQIGRHRLIRFAFNGQIPGPLLEVAHKARVTAIVSNQLPMHTTVHWHGLRLNPEYDGVPYQYKAPIAPGERFHYTLDFPDAGLFWYHPHVRDDIQVDMGLAGAMRVAFESEYHLAAVDQEHALLVDDILLGDDGAYPYGEEAPTHALMGRFGNTMLLNGVPDYSYTFVAGDIVRFSVTNTASTRTFNLSLWDDASGAPLPMRIVGTDLGVFPEDLRGESLVIGPAERYLFDVQMPDSGTVTLENRIQAIDHLKAQFFPERSVLGRFSLATRDGAPSVGGFETLVSRPDVREKQQALLQAAQQATTKRLALRLENKGLAPVTRNLMALDATYLNPIEWAGTMPMMNGASTSAQVQWVLEDLDTGAQNADIRWAFDQGELVHLTLVNDRTSAHAMQHPFHIHGQRFQVIRMNGEPVEVRAWKDTIIVPTGATVEVLVEMSNPGTWMMHCHIAEHLGSGMMGMFTVSPREGMAAPWNQASYH